MPLIGLPMGVTMWTTGHLSPINTLHVIIPAIWTGQMVWGLPH